MALIVKEEELAKDLREYSIDVLYERARAFRELSTIDPEPTCANLSRGIAVLFEYIAELKTPCEPGDVDCIQHHEKNCPCMNAYRKEQENGQTV